MNVRTDRLSDYVSATKKVARKKVQVEQAIVRSATSPAPELIEKANLNLEDATAKLEEAREDFKKSQDVVTRELLRYGEDNEKEWQASVQDYAQKQIMYEREKLNALEKAWDSIQHLRNGGPSGVDGRGASSEPSARSRSYWPSGLGVPFAPDLMRESRTSQPVRNDVVTSLKPLALEPESNLYQGRLPQNAGIGSGNVSGLNSGYNSGYNSDYTSGYNSGDQDEGMRSGQGYFPATKLSRSGSGPRTNKAAGTEPNKNGSVPAITTGSIVTPLTPLTPTDTGDRPLAAALPPPPPPPSKDTFIVEDTVKIKDGYDPLMVRPGFAD